jgi:hypothetical protein
MAAETLSTRTASSSSDESFQETMMTARENCDGRGVGANVSSVLLTSGRSFPLGGRELSHPCRTAANGISANQRPAASRDSTPRGPRRTKHLETNTQQCLQRLHFCLLDASFTAPPEALSLAAVRSGCAAACMVVPTVRGTDFAAATNKRCKINIHPHLLSQLPGSLWNNPRGRTLDRLLLSH